MSQTKIARRYIVRGRVQGVGFRYFVSKAAHALGIHGTVRNLDNGDVEVYAIGTKAQLDELAGLLWKGPRMADVRGVEETEAAVERHYGFHVE